MVMNRDQVRTNGGIPEAAQNPPVQATSSTVDVTIQNPGVRETVRKRRKVRYCPKCALLFRPKDQEWRDGTPYCPIHNTELQER